MSDEVSIDTALNTLMRPKSPWAKNEAERAAMTIACADANDIPRVANAGQSLEVSGTSVQVMHNGLYVKKNGYQGEWQAQTIEALKGVHEPQEEKVFYEVLKRISPNGVMIELGSWWSYYSMWFLNEVKRGKAICCEPDPTNMELGKANAELNKFKVGEDITFYHCASGSADGKFVTFENEDKSKNRVQIRTVDSIVSEQKLKKVDILHLDIQGAELGALKGAVETIKKGGLRFLFVSTHHYSISADPTLHQKCLDFIKKHGGNIVAAHTVLESCSGDGLIVASFDPRDKDFKVEISLQHSDDSLFRPYEYDIDILWQSHDKLVDYVNELKARLSSAENELHAKQSHLDELEGFINDITPLKKHLKRQVSVRVKKIRGIKKT